MTKNERQYRITKAQAARFETTIVEVIFAALKRAIDPQTAQSRIGRSAMPIR